MRAVGRDPWNDLVDAAGAPVDEPKYLDAIRLEADAVGSDLRMQLTVVGAPPPNLPATHERDAFFFALDTGGDAAPEYIVAFENDDAGAWRASLENLATGGRVEGAQFGGSIVLQERVVLVQVPIEQLGAPSTIRVCAIAQSAPGATGPVVARDSVPDGACRTGRDMLTLQ